MKIVQFTVILAALSSSIYCSYASPVALQMAYMAAIAYESPLAIEAWNCNYCSKYKVQFPKPFLNLSSNVRGFTGYSASLNTIVVSFKGADNLSTWIAELKTFMDLYDKCKDCQVNRGFYSQYLSIRPTVFNQVEALRKIFRNAKLYVVGHGLGGAFAQYAALDLKEIYSVVDGAYTFGSPRAGNFQFAMYYNKADSQTFRVIHSADIVPHLPLSSAGYYHSNFQIWYDQQMQSYKTCEGDQAGCSNSVPIQQLTTTDNAIADYIGLKPN